MPYKFSIVRSTFISRKAAPADGYVQVFVANESDVNVWFDDISITHTQADIAQENHYSSWGLNLAGIEKEGKPDHKFQYNSKEKQEEHGLNWIDYGARFYDPQLGRWHTVDPMTESQESWTPYHYVYNNPVLRTDPDGRCPDGDCPTVAGFLVNTVKDLAVSTFNAGVILLPGGAYNPAGDIRASRNENGDIQIGIRPPATNNKQALGNAASDVLDVGSTVATVGTGGTGGLAVNGGLLLAKTGGKAVVTNAVVQNGKKLLPGELNVGTYDDLVDAGSKGDNITPHHIPSANHMEKYGVAKGDGITINMEHPYPGTGGRHRQTATYGTKSDVNMVARKALATGIRDVRRIYMGDGLYNAVTRGALQEVIQKNKNTYPLIFGKP